MVRLYGSSQHQSLHWEVRGVEELAVVTENPLKELWRNPLAEFSFASVGKKLAKHPVTPCSASWKDDGHDPKTWSGKYTIWEHSVQLKSDKKNHKNPTQPIPKQTSLPKHRLEFPRFVITPCSPEPLLTLGKILCRISQPQSLPCIQAQEFGLALMQRWREILPHWRERSKSFLPQVHSPGDRAASYTSHLSWWLQIYTHGWRGPSAAKFSSSPSLSRAGVRLDPQLRAVLRTIWAECWSWGCRRGCQQKLPFSCATSFYTQQITFLIWTWLNIPYPVRIRKAGWLFAPRRMNASLYCICIISYQLQQVRESTTALLTSGLADSWKLNSTSATGDRKYRESILFTSRFVLNYPSLPPASHRCEEMRNRTGQHLSKQSWLVFLDTKINKLDWLNIPPPRECTLFAGKDKGS